MNMELIVEELSIQLKKKTIISNVNLNFQSGVHGLLGANGAGKTTLIRGILGLYEPKQGEIKFNQKPLDCRRINVGYLPQQFGLFKDLKVKQMMNYMTMEKEISKKNVEKEISDCLEAVDMLDKLEVRIKELSGGMVRRLGIAQALLGNPKILILDEPTAGLDPEEWLRVKNLIYKIKQNRIIILSTHIVEDLEAVCDYIEIMDRGKVLYQNRYDEVIQLAKGKVYEVNRQELSNLQDYYMLKEYEKEGEVKFRILSNQELAYLKLEPTIEDGYLCVTKGFVPN